MLYQRGLEIGLAGASVINGRAALMSNEHGATLAPFLYSALSQLSKEPRVWAIFLTGVGVAHLIVLAATFRGKKTAMRALMMFIQTGVYVAVTVAILTSTRDAGGAERYAWSACLSFLCFVVLTSRAVAKGGDDG